MINAVNAASMTAPTMMSTMTSVLFHPPALPSVGDSAAGMVGAGVSVAVG